VDECKPLGAGAGASAAEGEALNEAGRAYSAGRGLHSSTQEPNLSTFGTHSWVNLGYVGHKDRSS